MPTVAQKAAAFRALHDNPGLFVIPNPWDAGSARILASLGFKALATTSSGYAYSIGKVDGEVKRDEALANARAICAATDVPVNGDLENLYAHEPDAAAATIAMAADAGLAGCSIEDATGDKAVPIYEFDMAVARVHAAVAAARALPFPFVLTARAENFLHGRRDMADTIRRLQAFEAAGADVLYAPGLADMAAVKQVLAAVKRPVNVLVSSGNAQLDVAGLAAAGVKRISTGGALARAAITGFVAAAREIAGPGTFTYGRSILPASDIDPLIKGQ
ncbi:MAG: isocitrate lyase/phosphoenolpyruvate mutase family protein [Hyphomicrobiaceae bacterium]